MRWLPEFQTYPSIVGDANTQVAGWYEQLQQP